MRRIQYLGINKITMYVCNFNISISTKKENIKNQADLKDIIYI